MIQGGAGDIVKVAMNKCHDFLRKYKSRLLLNIHDELVFEIYKGEEHLISFLKGIMETAYKHKYVPLTCGVEYSDKSLADKLPYSPLQFKDGKETRDGIQG